MQNHVHLQSLDDEIEKLDKEQLKDLVNGAQLYFKADSSGSDTCSDNDDTDDQEAGSKLDVSTAKNSPSGSFSEDENLSLSFQRSLSGLEEFENLSSDKSLIVNFKNFVHQTKHFQSEKSKFQQMQRSNEKKAGANLANLEELRAWIEARGNPIQAQDIGSGSLEMMGLVDREIIRDEKLNEFNRSLIQLLKYTLRFPEENGDSVASSILNGGLYHFGTQIKNSMIGLAIDKFQEKFSQCEESCQEIIREMNNVQGEINHRDLDAFMTNYRNRSKTLHYYMLLQRSWAATGGS